MEIRYEIDKTIYFNNNYETDIKIVEIIDFMIDCLLIIGKSNLVYNIFEFILIEKNLNMFQLIGTIIIKIRSRLWKMKFSLSYDYIFFLRYLFYL